MLIDDRGHSKCIWFVQEYLYSMVPSETVGLGWNTISSTESGILELKEMNLEIQSIASVMLSLRASMFRYASRRDWKL